MSPIRETEDGPAILGRAVAALDSHVDWQLLGELYCHEGGVDFFPREQRDLLYDAGLAFAADLGQELSTLPDFGCGASLYLGGAAFELVPVLFEHLVLGRVTIVLNLDGAEARELNRALAVVEEELECALPRIDTRGFPPVSETTFDHVWMTSVLTDPEAFPALHDKLYAREGTELSAGGGDLEAEHRKARTIVSRLFDRTATPCVITTTDEELVFIEDACALAGRRLVVPKTARLSGIVGDPVRHCRLTRSQK